MILDLHGYEDSVLKGLAGVEVVWGGLLLYFSGRPWLFRVRAVVAVFHSPHILETVFRVAEQNRIQLICLTAHKEEEILSRFPVVYSLQLRPAYGKEVMKVENVERGFFHLVDTEERE
ncbi:hypothetical protein [Paludifilum halophilum]|uniref:Uncharacterized protein n=1 Tax=Paludifilum halophilum TaxID=1642702 RepID=A0A235B9P1_9BACL|nr:hypothetical protein [Paludifilum halophilum]OYD08942.1 hypothetical protein CHM34_03960 [Paludifilum halophilum]